MSITCHITMMMKILEKDRQLLDIHDLETQTHRGWKNNKKLKIFYN